MKAGLLAALMVLMAGAVWAGEIEVVDAWSRASAGPSTTGVAYLTIKNGSGSDDKLVSVTTPSAKVAQLHIHAEENGIMTMRQVDSIDLSAGKSVTLMPEGYHIMLLSLAAPLKEGDHFPLTLTFQKAGSKTVTVNVKGVAAMEGTMDGHHHMGDMGH